MRVSFAVAAGLALCTMSTTASAQNSMICLKPWAIPDKWIDNHDDPNDGQWTPDDSFETVDAHGNPLPDPDVYVQPGPNVGSGFRLPQDLGLLLTLKIADPQDGMKSGFFYAIDLGTGEGADGYRSAIATCQDTPPVFIGSSLQPQPGNLKGPTVQGVADLINLDPNAEWDPVTRTVINSCAPSLACGSMSPRIVSVIAFDPEWYEGSWRSGGQPQLVAMNIISLFIDGIAGGKVTGYITMPRWLNNPQP